MATITLSRTDDFLPHLNHPEDAEKDGINDSKLADIEHVVRELEVSHLEPDPVQKVELQPITIPPPPPTQEQVKSVLENSSVQTSLEIPKLPVPRFEITVQYDGATFLLPWSTCCTWKGMQAPIRTILKRSDKHLAAFEEQRFELLVDSNQVLPEFWDLLVQPGWIIKLKFTPPKDKEEENNKSDEKEDGSGPTGTRYRDTVSYTVKYYRKTETESSLQGQVTYDNPVKFNTVDDIPKVLPVFEEIKKVTTFQIKDNSTSPAKSFDVPTVDDTNPKLPASAEIGEPSLKIHSPYLMNTLQAVIKYSWKIASGTTNSFENGMFDYPFWDLIQYKDDLLEYKRDNDGLRSKHSPEYNEICDRHIDVLIKYLYSRPTLPLAEFEADWKETVPMTSFTGLGFLLRAGSDVYVRENGDYSTYVIENVVGGTSFSKVDEIAPYEVFAWKLIFDGKCLKRAKQIINIPVFDNRRPILTLPVIPTRFHDSLDGGERRRELIARGRKFFEFAKKPTFLEYSGTGLKAGRKAYSHTRVVVEHVSQPWTSRKTDEPKKDFDPEFWYQSPAYTRAFSHPVVDEDGDVIYYHNIGNSARIPLCGCNDCSSSQSSNKTYIRPTYSEYDNIDPNNENSEPFSDHQCLICPSHMFGYILKDRTYDLLHINGLKLPDISEQAIDKLIMEPETNKDMIKAIVKTYTEKDNRFQADFIHGKGEGQIFLLHGPPGTGKTLTAESVAEYTRRPLLGITAADLGHEPQTLEVNLLTFFKNATDWDAIVLLDEADVYLERRDARDMTRNSIVAVFLRALEYFQGIMFLTTNRVAQFDEAFMSRIHVSIGYDALTDKARGTIWDNLFRKLQEDFARNRGIEITYDFFAREFVHKSPDVKALKWNGREIRNAFQTAVALALYDSNKNGGEKKPVITDNHLRQVVEMSTAFKSYIKSAHDNMESSDLALQHGNRDDDYYKNKGR